MFFSLKYEPLTRCVREPCCFAITIPLSTRLYGQRYLFWLRGWDLLPFRKYSRLPSPRRTFGVYSVNYVSFRIKRAPTFDIVVSSSAVGLPILLISRLSNASLYPPPAALGVFVPLPPPEVVRASPISAKQKKTDPIGSVFFCLKIKWYFDTMQR